jgi:hypothetical protein
MLMQTTRVWRAPAKAERELVDVKIEAWNQVPPRRHHHRGPRCAEALTFGRLLGSKMLKFDV